MYNEHRKRQYLKEKSEASIISNNISNIFDTAAPIEEKYNRDISEWTSSEIIGLYKYLGTPYIQSLVQLNNSLNDYTNWCISNGLVRDNQNHFTEISSAELCKCIDLNELGQLVVTRRQVATDIKSLNNFCDRFVILGLFEGIPVKDGIIKNVKYSDLNGNELQLTNGNTLHISDELRSVMEFAADEHSWISYSDKRHHEISYYEDGCILRYTQRKNGDPVISSPTILVGSRLRKAVSFMGWSPKMTIKTLMESGRLHMMREIANSLGIEMKETILNPNIRSSHEKIFGQIQNRATYFETYGRFFDDDGDVKNN